MAERLYDLASEKKWDEVVKAATTINSPDNFTDDKGHTALHKCVMNGAPSDAVSGILAKGADPNKKQAHGNTALHLAVAANQPTSPELTVLLIKSGADPNKRNGAEMTPLHVAVTVKASMAVFQSLLTNGADPSKKVKGKTVGEAARLAGMTEIVEFLGGAGGG
jgi:ankyrin repeat protein